MKKMKTFAPAGDAKSGEAELVSRVARDPDPVRRASSEKQSVGPADCIVLDFEMRQSLLKKLS